MNQKLVSFLRVGALLMLLLTIPLFSANAINCKGNNATGGSNQSGVICNPLAFDTVEQAINGILQVIINLAAVVLVVFFVYSGFLFVSAQGDPDKLKTARAAFKYTVIGSAILLGAQALTILIHNTLEPIFRK